MKDIREYTIPELFGESEAFSEVWHIQRTLNDPQADWYVAGIQQEDLPES